MGIAGEPERPIADQAGAEQRCGMQIGITLGHRKTKAFVGDAKLGIAAIDVIAGEAGAYAQVLEAAAAEAAGLVDEAEPGNADTFTGHTSVGARPGRMNLANNHVADHER